MFIKIRIKPRTHVRVVSLPNKDGNPNLLVKYILFVNYILVSKIVLIYMCKVN